MSRKISIASAILFLSSPALAENAITIGFTESDSGKILDDSTNQVNGYKLWRDQVNAAGGISIGGKKYKVNFVVRDDQSKSDQLQQLYTRLILQDNADFLFSPYSSGLTATAALISEQYGKIMMASGAADDAIYQNGNHYLYQIYSPASSYLKGILDIIKTFDSDGMHDHARVSIIYEDDTFTKAVAAAAEEYAQSINVNVVYTDTFVPSTTDFSQYLTKMTSTKTTVLIGGGHYLNGAAFAKQIYDQGIKLNLASLLVAPDNPQFSSLGKAALNVTVPVQWSSQITFTPNFGPSSNDFNKSYRTTFKLEPGYHAAGGYAAGIILQHALEKAGTTDTAVVARELDKINEDTFFGHIQFATDPGNHGLQIGHKMIILQWQGTNQLTKVAVWPVTGSTAKIAVGNPK